MSRAQTLLALGAVVFASLSAVNIGGRPRPLLAAVAVALLALLGYLRLRASASAKRPTRSFDAYERALRIQERRDKKYWR